MTATAQTMTEADTCRERVTTKLTNAGRGSTPVAVVDAKEQVPAEGGMQQAKEYTGWLR